MKKGLLITVEGGDGSGKTTQIQLLKEFLTYRGEDILFTREPGGTPISEKIRAVILDKKNAEMAPLTEALLYAASRAQHVAQVIGPALEHGKLVVCDRFVDSSVVYQGYARDLGDCVSEINGFAVGNYLPDYTFFLKLPPEKAEKRLQQHNKDRMEKEDRSFHQRVYDGYLSLAAAFPHRIIVIDADQSPAQVAGDIQLHMERILEERDER